LGALINAHALVGLDSQGVAPGDEILAARFRDRDRARLAAPDLFAAQGNHRIANEAFVRDFAPTRLIGLGRFARQHRLDLLALETLDQEMQTVAKRPAIEELAKKLERRETIEEQPFRFGLADFREQQTVMRLELLEQDQRGGVNHPQFTRRFLLAEIPAESRGVAQQFFRRKLERNDQARLMVLHDAAVDELQTKRGLARAGGAFHQHDVALLESSEKDLIETVDAGLYQLSGLGHV